VCQCSELEARVPIAIDIHLLYGANRHAQPIVLQHLSERSTVDEIYWTCAFSRCLRGRSGAESPLVIKSPLSALPSTAPRNALTSGA